MSTNVELNESEVNNFLMDAKPGPVLGVRHLQAALLFLAMLLGFCMRVNMSVAIVAMTDPDISSAQLNWSMTIQGVILSSFFWGYVVLQVPGGELARRYGGKRLILISIAVNGIVTLLIPYGAVLGGWKLLCGFRVLQGLTQGFLFPSTHALLGKWAPIEEKSRLTTAIYAGCQLGTAIELVVAGFLSASRWGWPSIFYSLGAVSLAWCGAYAWLGADSPEDSTIISQVELVYIQTSLGHLKAEKIFPTPWRSILTSLPFWSLVVAHCGMNWGFWTLLTETPTYMNKVLHFDIKSNGIYSALPYLTMYVLSFPIGYISDLSIKRKWVTVTAARKISNTIGFWGPAAALIGLCYSASPHQAIALLTVAMAFNSGYYAGYNMVHIDMAPNFAGPLMGITNGIANIVSLCAPLAAGFILKDETDPIEWRTVFFISSGVFFLSNLIFIIFGTSEKQPWNECKNIIVDESAYNPNPSIGRDSKQSSTSFQSATTLSRSITKVSSGKTSSSSNKKSSSGKTLSSLTTTTLKSPMTIPCTNLNSFTYSSSSVQFPFRPPTFGQTARVAIFIGLL